MAKVKEISNEELLTLKAIQLFPLLPMAIYILIMVIIQTMVLYDGESSMVGSSFIVTLVTVILGIIGIATLVLAYFLPQWIINSYKKKSQPPPGLVVIGIVRAVCFLFTSILGLVMAILSGWIAGMLLFLAIFTVMILTFPNRERLYRLLEGGDYNSRIIPVTATTTPLTRSNPPMYHREKGEALSYRNQYSITTRNPLKCIFLSYITFGIYDIVWFYQTSEEMNAAGAKIPAFWQIFIPFANILWLYKFCEGIHMVTQGRIERFSAFFLLLILGPVGGAIIQHQLNKIAQFS